MYINTIENGMAMSMPNVCKTPVGPAVVPIPYPSMARMQIASPNSHVVLVVGSCSLATNLKIQNTISDEAGVQGGVVSNVNMGLAQMTSGSKKVFIQGKPAARMQDSVKSNKGNAMGQVAQPSQTKVSALS